MNHPKNRGVIFPHNQRFLQPNKNRGRSSGEPHKNRIRIRSKSERKLEDRLISHHSPQKESDSWARENIHADEKYPGKEVV